MTFILGMLVASCIACMAFLVGYGAGIATIPREVPDDPDPGERADVVTRLTPTIPTRPMTGKEIAASLVAELDKVTTSSFGVNGTRSKALERM